LQPPAGHGSASLFMHASLGRVRGRLVAPRLGLQVERHRHLRQGRARGPPLGVHARRRHCGPGRCRAVLGRQHRLRRASRRQRRRFDAGSGGEQGRVRARRGLGDGVVRFARAWGFSGRARQRQALRRVVDVCVPHRRLHVLRAAQGRPRRRLVHGPGAGDVRLRDAVEDAFVSGVVLHVERRAGHGKFARLYEFADVHLLGPRRRHARGQLLHRRRDRRAPARQGARRDPGRPFVKSDGASLVGMARAS
jgi:hypothetical protein